MIKGTDKVDYRYLNMDSGELVDSQEDLTEEVGKGGLMRAIPNLHGQVLIAAGQRNFSEFEAKFKCRKLTGMIE